MAAELIVKGLLIGISVAAPVGPIGVLCLQRSLTKGWRHGVVTGLGAAAADMVYGAIAALGLVGVLHWLQPAAGWLQLLGGLLLAYLGWRVMVSKEAAAALDVGDQSPYLKSFYSTFLLTLANPMTLMAFMAILSSVGLSSGKFSPWWLVFGVFCGSALWWLFLSLMAEAIRARLRDSGLQWISRVSGLSLLIIGGWAVLTGLQGYPGLIDVRHMLLPPMFALPGG
ncbi:MAG: LysE family transporter [Motiliproteus sp.]